MLVLTRKRGQEIVIHGNGDVIIVTLLEIQGDGKVRFGVAAPQNLQVDRREVYDQKLLDRKGETK